MFIISSDLHILMTHSEAALFVYFYVCLQANLLPGAQHGDAFSLTPQRAA